MKNLSIFLLWLMPLILYAMQFEKHTITTSATNAISVYTADINGDGKLDVLSGGGSKISWYENDGSQNFTAHDINTTLSSAYSVYALDLDGDSDIDVFSADFGGNSVAWYENDGSGGFTSHAISTSSGPYSVFAINVDGDSDIDVLSANCGAHKVAWYENDGSQNFTEHNISTTGTCPNGIYAINIDGDSDMDVLSSDTNNQIVWYENDGSQNFTEHIISTSATTAADVYAIDIDQDGDIDVLSASQGDDKIAWYENDGSQNFTEHSIATTADNAIFVRAIDLDADGDIDVLSASPGDNTVAWYENDGSQNFTKHALTTTTNSPREVHVADLNGDGYNEVLSASASDNTVTWYDIIPFLKTAAHGGVLQFDGTGKVTRANYSGLDSKAQATVEMWLYPVASSGVTQYPFQLQFSALDAVMISRATSCDDMTVNLSNGSSAQITFTDLFKNPEWHHVAIVYNGSESVPNDRVKVYLDGVLQSGSPTGTFPTSLSASLSSAPLYLGYQYKGLLDEVRIWDTNRSQSEIRATMNEQLTGSESNLIAYYKFDEIYGQTVRNSATATGSTYDGTIQGGVKRISPNQKSLWFSGGHPDYVDMGNVIEGMSQVSYSAWIRPADLQSGTHHEIAGKRYVDALVLFGDTGQIYYTTYGSTCYSNQTLTPYRWYHVAASFSDSQDTIKLYIDGELDKTCTGMTDTIGTSTDSRGIGKNIGAGDGYFHGNIAKVSLWNKVLTHAEIRRAMYGDLTGSESGLLAYWPLNEGAPGTAYDQTNSYNGTKVGDDWNETAPDINGSSFTVWPGLPLSSRSLVEYNTSAFSYTASGDSINQASVYSSVLGNWYYAPGDAFSGASFSVTATDGSSTFSQTNTAVKSSNYAELAVTLKNVSLSEHNITNVRLIPGDTNETNLSLISSVNDGTNTLSVAMIDSASTYKILVDVNSSDTNQTESWWVYDDSGTYRMISAKNSAVSVSATGSRLSMSVDMGSGSWKRDVTSDLEAYYMFDNNLTDSSGNGRNLSSASTESYVTGALGSAYHFDGSNYLTSTSFTGSGEGSIAFWLKRDIALNDDNYMYLSSNDGTTEGTVRIFHWNGTATNGLAAEARGSLSGTYVTSANGGNIYDDQWHHVVLTFTNGERNIYIDGSAKTISGTDDYELELNTTLHLGHEKAQLQDNGSAMDDLRIYSRMLSASEALAVYTQGLISGVPTSYTFSSTDVGSTTTHTFTLTNSSSAAQTINFAVSGTGFSISPSTCSIAASGTCDVTLSFSPTSASSHSGTVTIAELGMSFNISGNGLSSSTSTGGGGSATPDDPTTTVNSAVSSETGENINTSNTVSVPTDSSVSYDSESGTVSAEFTIGEGDESSDVTITTPAFDPNDPTSYDSTNENIYTLTTIKSSVQESTSLLTPPGTLIRPLGNGLQFNLDTGNGDTSQPGINSVAGAINSDGSLTVTTQSTTQDDEGNTITVIQEVQINSNSHTEISPSGEVSATATMGTSLGTVTTRTIVSSGGHTSVTVSASSLGTSYRSTPPSGSEHIGMDYIDYSYYDAKTKTIDQAAKKRVEARALTNVDLNALRTQFTSNRNFTVYEREDDPANNNGVVSSSSSSSTSLSSSSSSLSSANGLGYLMEKDLTSVDSVEIVPTGNSDEGFEDILRFDGVRTIKLTSGAANIIIDGETWKMMPGLTYEVQPETTEETVEEEQTIGNDNESGDELFIDGIFYLRAGWNLITAPTDEELTLTGVVNSVSWKYTYDNGWEKDSTTLEPKKGYWIQLSAEQELDLGVNGAVYKPNYSDLESGWHLLGTGQKLSLVHNAETIQETWVFDKENTWSRNPSLIFAGQGFWVRRK